MKYLCFHSVESNLRVHILALLLETGTVQALFGVEGRVRAQKATLDLPLSLRKNIGLFC